MSTPFSQIMDKINRIALDEQPYLQSMIGIDGLPDLLYCLGNIPSHRLPTVAIVGSRKPTNYGREVTHELAYQLAARGIVIVSGLAFGVDSIAHQAVLKAGGMTIAVQANGLDSIYPRSHHQLAKDIVSSGGAIVSEYPVGTPPMQHHFLERNRIVSALADVIIVTEAASRSGTLNTAGHALAQGREVAVVPGNITSAMSVGCNNLIKQGALPITSVDDVIEILGFGEDRDQLPLPLGENPVEQQIIRALSDGLRSGDDIIKSISDVSPTEFSTALTMLEIRGVIKSLGNNHWSLT